MNRPCLKAQVEWVRAVLDHDHFNPNPYEKSFFLGILSSLENLMRRVDAEVEERHILLRQANEPESAAGGPAGSQPAPAIARRDES